MSMDATIRYDEGDDAVQSTMLWDTLPAYGPALEYSFDWALAGPAEPGNSMGLGATNAFETAVVIQLFSNRRAVNPNGSSDPQGWWGDAISFDDDDQPIGSLLWTLRRSPLTPAVAAQAVVFAKQALQILITQGAVATLTVTSQIDQIAGALWLFVTLYSADGTTVYQQKFGVYWAQVSK